MLYKVITAWIGNKESVVLAFFTIIICESDTETGSQELKCWSDV